MQYIMITPARKSYKVVINNLKFKRIEDYLTENIDLYFNNS